MARYRQPYTFYTRPLKSGKRVYYYQTYTEDGKRTCGMSTGQTTKSGFLNYMAKLIRDGNLVPERRSSETFREHTRTWWEWTRCAYIARQLTRNSSAISREYAKNCRSELENHLVPVFGDYRLDEITPGMIEEWILKEKKNGRKSDATINHCLKNLKKIMGEAYRLGVIKTDPTSTVQLVHEKRKPRGILSMKEVRNLLNDAALSTVWDNHLIHFTINLTAASTGMRQSELLAVTKESFHGEYIDVSTSYRPLSKEKSTKTNRPRVVPVPERVRHYLSRLSDQTNHYLFSLDTGITPIAGRTVTSAFYRALARSGISNEEQKRRNIVFHSWRHFFNTYCRSDNVSDAKLQAVTGHSTMKMTDNYTRFDISHFQDVMTLQEELIRKII